MDDLTAKIVFEPPYRNPDALKGLDGFSYIWLIWEFTKTHTNTFHASVRPPRVGGNGHMGVFATRSPYRPNSLGLSSVRIKDIIPESEEGPVIIVGGADILSGTPVYDIKPYLPYADCHEDARAGFAGLVGDYRLDVHMSEEVRKAVPHEKLAALTGVLAEDPRPSYENRDEGRIYGMHFGDLEVKFCITGKDLTVVSVSPIEQ